MEPVILYSINSLLAYNISRQYYHKHYVWCAIKFDTNDLPATERNNPVTSNPIEIYKLYQSDINGMINDDHYNPTFLKERITGILMGLEKNKDLVGEDVYNELSNAIKSKLESKKIWKELEPLVYIIPYELVKGKIKTVPPSKTAGLLSNEYIIEDLLDSEFDVITNLGGLK